MKTIFALLFSIIQFISIAQNLHSFKVESLTGEIIDFSAFKGKKILVVNTASKCGLTPQYEELEKLYQKYKDKNFVILGFPSNDFMSQEPGTNSEIEEFCKKNYGVTFQMMTKVNVKGADQHPVYQFLTQKEKNGFENSEVKWNFHKFLIDEKGNLVKNLSPRTSPMDKEIINWIEGVK